MLPASRNYTGEPATCGLHAYGRGAAETAEVRTSLAPAGGLKRLEAAGRAKLAKGAAAVWGAIGAAVMFALTWLVGGHFPKS
jgi:hypothetical protein